MKLKISESQNSQDFWNKIKSFNKSYLLNYNLKYLLIKRKIFYKNKKYID